MQVSTEFRDARFMSQAHQSATEEHPPGPRPPLVPAAARELALDATASAVILVEGWSDQAAIDTLARRRGWDLRTEGILTLPIGGVTNLGAFIQCSAHRGSASGWPVCAMPPTRTMQDALLNGQEWGTHLTRTGLEAMGFFVCEADLEDELIRALGTTAVEAVLNAQGGAQLVSQVSGTACAKGTQPQRATASLHGYTARGARSATGRC